jgi:hypothetical protein
MRQAADDRKRRREELHLKRVGDFFSPENIKKLE